MKRIIFFCFALFLSATVVSAQADRSERRGDRRGGDPEKREAQLLERLTKSLELTDQQLIDIQSFQATNKVNREEDMAAAESREEKRAVVKQYAEQFDQHLTGILTAEQQEKYTKIKARRKGNERGERRPRRGNDNELDSGGF